MFCLPTQLNLGGNRTNRVDEETVYQINLMQDRASNQVKHTSIMQKI